MIDKQTQLAWLDKQRSIVNDMIINLPPDEQGKLLPELQVINAIAERVREMTAVEYLEAHCEMCDECASDVPYCKGCPLNETNPTCRLLEDTDPRRAVELVKRWKEKAEYELLQDD